ncbi:aminoglycoside phosphotransferase family protein [Catenulispora yoronensis]|uniref:aminoglycoside phosphotransferase family protein n=1 Tax=Catenulispora yoronensis TaxID=450799 RepID=UPI0031DA22B6
MTEDVARRLIDSQFPQWSALPLTPVVPGGSDHAIFRLGTELTVRLPRHAGAMRQARKEAAWLPRLAPQLPLETPLPEAVGTPGLGYPWSWAVHRWMPGEPATADTLADSVECAQTLAEFVTALQRCAIDGAEDDPDVRGGTQLAARNADTRAAIVRTAGTFDATAMTEVWDAALAAPAWDRPPVWVHGDFHTGNILTRAGRVAAVLDFGELAVGDPAPDTMIAFTLLGTKTREVYRSALGVDDATWARGRGWALVGGLNAYVSYAAVNPWVEAVTTRQIRAAIAG